MKTLKIRKILITALTLTTLTACQAPTSDANRSTVSPDQPTAAAAPAAVAPIPTPSPTVTTTPVTVTYYTASKTEAPISGWATKTYTATGKCLVYSAHTYCWDDGLKILQWSSGGVNYGPYGYTYFGVGHMSGSVFTLHGYGTLVDDSMMVPTVITASMETNMVTSSGTVLSSGAPTQVSCTDSNGTLTCPGFSIDLNQLPL